MLACVGSGSASVVVSVPAVAGVEIASTSGGVPLVKFSITSASQSARLLIVLNAAAVKASDTTKLTISGGYIRIFLLSIFSGCGGCAELPLCLLCYPLQ